MNCWMQHITRNKTTTTKKNSWIHDSKYFDKNNKNEDISPNNGKINHLGISEKIAYYKYSWFQKPK